MPVSGKGSGSSCGCLYLNDVVYSTNQGVSFTLSTLMAPWGARSDMAVAVAPKTNYIVMMGGNLIPNGNVLNVRSHPHHPLPHSTCVDRHRPLTCSPSLTAVC